MGYPSNYYLLFFCSTLLFFIYPFIKAVTSPTALVLLPITKDQSTNQHATQIYQRTPLVPVKLVLALGGPNLWVNCNPNNYVSSTYKPIYCNSTQCALAQSRTCINDTCSLLTDNRVTNIPVGAVVAQDIVAVQATDGSNPGRFDLVPEFIFTCGSTFYLQGLASGVEGIAGLGRSLISLPSQFSSAFGFDRKFALCLANATNGRNGFVLFGDVPRSLSDSLIYTPLILNPVSTASAYFESEASADYFIGVTSINIDGNNVLLNTTLLKIDNEGIGGTRISTINPYTVMETSIYQAFVNTCINSFARVPRVPNVAPFGSCFNSTFIRIFQYGGPGVPGVNFVLQSSSVVWRIWTSNLMVQVEENVLCLAFIDGGENLRTSIVIGAHQLEDNLLLFDLTNSVLGFGPSDQITRQTTCANFNFTLNA